jgi:peptidoglycan biosynthesis protein MviN/MurJ (putative lipid II flippase)
MLNLLKSMVIILTIMIVCMAASITCVMLMDYVFELSSTMKGVSSLVIWGFGMIWVGGILLNVMGRDG